MIDNTNLKNDMAQPFSRRHMIMPPATSAQINDAEGTELKTYTVTVDGTEITEDMNLETKKIPAYISMNIGANYPYAKRDDTLYVARRTTSSSTTIDVYKDNSLIIDNVNVSVSTVDTRMSIFTKGEDLYIADNDVFYKIDLTAKTGTLVAETTVPYDVTGDDVVTETHFFEIADGVVACNYLEAGETYKIAVSTDLKTWTKISITGEDIPLGPIKTANPGYTLDTKNNACYLVISNSTGSYQTTMTGFYGVRYASGAIAVLLNMPRVGYTGTRPSNIVICDGRAYIGGYSNQHYIWSVDLANPVSVQLDQFNLGNSDTWLILFGGNVVSANNNRGMYFKYDTTTERIAGDLLNVDALVEV